MSKENAVNFFKAVENDDDLKGRLKKADKSVESWLAFGKEAGFEFGGEDLRVVSEALTDRELTEETCVQAVLDGMNELSEEDLRAAAGGAGGRLSFSRRLSRIGIGAPGGKAGYVSDRGPSWVDGGGMGGLEGL